MADIRDYECGHGHTQTTAKPSWKEEQEARLNFGKRGELAAANRAADAARKYGVSIFGRMHAHNFDSLESAQDTADKIGGTVVVINE